MLNKYFDNIIDKEFTGIFTSGVTLYYEVV